MSKHRKTIHSPRMSARQYVATTVGGAAMVGVGILLASPPGASGPVTASPEVQLASFGSTLAPVPLDAADPAWWLNEGGDLFGAGAATPNALAAALSGIN